MEPTRGRIFLVIESFCNGIMAIRGGGTRHLTQPCYSLLGQYWIEGTKSGWTRKAELN